MQVCLRQEDSLRGVSSPPTKGEHELSRRRGDRLVWRGTVLNRTNSRSSMGEGSVLKENGLKKKSSQTVSKNYSEHHPH